MEIPVINRIIDFETNINPSFVPQVSAVSAIGKFYQTSNLWKWGALILAVIASFTTIINRVKLLIAKLQKHPSLSPSQYHLFDDADCGSDTDSFSSEVEEDDDEEVEEEEEDDEDDSARASYSDSRNWRLVDEDFRVRGSEHGDTDDEQWQNRNLGLRRRRGSIGDIFFWSELMTSGKSVVKLWDNLGLGLGLNMDYDSGNEFHIYDTNTDRKITSVFGRRDETPAFASSSPAVIVSAATNYIGGVTLSGWDTRVGSRLPAIMAEWRPKLGTIVGIKAGGVEKVLVRDSLSNAVTVGDMRMVNSPLTDPTGADVGCRCRD